MKNKEYLEFLTGHSLPPELLKEVTKKDISLSFKKGEILLKFFGLQLLGALFSMSVCPQFGMGLVQGHGITHQFRMIGDWACAAFCGALFLTCGMLVAFMAMKGAELWWVWRRYKVSMIFLPAILWGGLMLTNVTLDLPSETPSYHMTWIAMAIFAETLWFHFRSSLYIKDLAGNKPY